MTFKKLNQKVRLSENQIDPEVFDFVDELQNKGFERKDISKKLKKEFGLSQTDIKIILQLV